MNLTIVARNYQIPKNDSYRINPSVQPYKIDLRKDKILLVENMGGDQMWLDVGIEQQTGWIVPLLSLTGIMAGSTGIIYLLILSAPWLITLYERNYELNQRYFRRRVRFLQFLNDLWYK